MPGVNKDVNDKEPHLQVTAAYAVYDSKPIFS